MKICLLAPRFPFPQFGGDVLRLNEISKYHPNNFDIYYTMGMIYTMLNDFSSAKTCYEKAAIINSLEYNTTYNIAMIELILGELEEAEKYFNKCIEDEELSQLA